MAACRGHVSGSQKQGKTERVQSNFFITIQVAGGMGVRRGGRLASPTRRPLILSTQWIIFC